ncbi:MAG TPA: NADH-quinone oxidoreductase subunit L [Candidatus Polarisedimenticolia bacterium]|nr:NADH-quinone oxidoreductase subunit L [Candidatus Polarisedimenticolia bacterium]
MLKALYLIPLLPLAGFVLNGLLGRRLSKPVVGIIACGTVLVAFFLSLGAVMQLGHLESVTPIAGRLDVDQDAKRVTLTAAEWLHAGRGRQGAEFSIPWGFTLDPLSAVMLLVVTGVGFLIHVYSVGYMAHEEGYWRYFAYLNLFMAMMLTLVLGSSFPVMFVGWEGVGLCSYLLIGFDYPKDSAADAGKKAFLVNRVGDMGFVLAMAWIFASLGTLDFTSVMAQASHLTPVVAAAIGVLLFFGACGKSAQIPLYVWLPDAMAGPTPVSALIHAATMVTAGVYMVCRCSAIYLQGPQALMVVATVGALTAIFAASMALRQNDIKKVLAYSTVSQLGYMFLAAGVGAFTAAIFHLMTHAFFKALLFLGSGSVIHAMSGEQDLRKMGGLKKTLPITFATFLVGTLAIAGIPPLSGYFSKDEILWKAFGAGNPLGLGGPIFWAIGLIAAALTTFYMFRLVFLCFYGEGRMDQETAHHLHESPKVMTIPLIILALLSAVGGLVGIPASLSFGRDLNAFERFLAPVFEPAGTVEAGGEPMKAAAESHAGMAQLEYLLMLLALGVVAVSIFTAYRFYRARPEIPQRLAAMYPRLADLLANKFYVDELYDRIIVKPYWWKCNLLAAFDRRIVDGLVNAVGAFTEVCSQLLKLFHTGQVRRYALWFMFGVLAVLWYLA